VATQSLAVAIGGTSYTVALPSPLQLTPVTPPAPAPPPAPAAPACDFGVWDPASGYPGYTWDGAAKFSAAPVKSVTAYLAWLAPFPSALVTTAAQHGAGVYLNLEPWNTWGNLPNPAVPDIAAGKYDSYLTQIGQGIKAGGVPVRVTWAHEMNGNGWYPWQQSAGVTPAQWVAGWTRVYQVIKAAAGNLAQMTWCPNNADVGPVAPYWPGAAYVDVPAFDGYLNQPSPAQTYGTFVRQTVDQIAALTKLPVWNAETGIAGANREARITQFAADMRADGRVSGFTWWNQDGFALDAGEVSALTAAVNAWNAA
jgi:Glycosyl hydrolase family 26